jgi:formylglycine-generating enzyme required for sulfatase activity
MPLRFGTVVVGLCLVWSSGCGPRQPGLPVSKVPVVTNSIGMEFVEIPSGKFLMGAIPGDELANENENPQHEVTISKAFYFGRFEVTQRQYADVIGDNPSYFSAGGRGANDVSGWVTDNFPVEMVNWFEANQYCEKLSNLPEEKAAGRTYRLPTEAEWEYACRAGTVTRFAFGTIADPKLVNFKGYVGRTQPVGSYPPNAWGLHDIQGNVLEWCSDWHTDDYYSVSPAVDPPGPEFSPDDVRVLRGGGYAFTPASASFRDDIPPHFRGPGHGLRVVMERN